MATTDYHPITPEQVYAGLADLNEPSTHRFSTLTRPHAPTGNNYIDLFAEQVRIYGKQSLKSYAHLMDAEIRSFDGAIRCLTGMTTHDWVCGYVNLVVCDLLAHTNWELKEIGRLIGLSSSSFTQYFRTQKNMQPWEYRSLKKYGRSISFFPK